MSEFWLAIVLGVVQGVAEFLPISSDGHLIIFKALLERLTGTAGPELESLEMVVALHIGSLFTITLVFWRELLALRHQPRLCALIVLATIPVVVVGLCFKKQFELLFNRPIAAGCGLLVTAGFLLLGQKLERCRDTLQTLKPYQALVVGLFQAIAPLPGVSRSGSTIAGGLLSGLTRDTAAQFSFLIAVPAIGGATVLYVKEWIEAGKSQYAPSSLIAGALVSFVVGIFALRWLIKVISRRRLHWFAFYCLAAGLATIAWQLLDPPASRATREGTEVTASTDRR